MANRMSPDTQKLLFEYENVEKQLQVLILQKHQIQLQLNEIKLAEEEIKKAEGEIYKSVGSVMVKSTKQSAETDLKERKEMLEMRMGSIGKQEEKLRERLTGSQKKLQDEMKKAG